MRLLHRERKGLPMLERYRTPLLAGLIFAAFMIALLSLVHPRAFAQDMGEYGSILKDSGSADKFKPLEVRPTDMGSHTKFDSDADSGAKTDFGKAKGDFKATFDTKGEKFDTSSDFKSGGDFKSSDDFKPSFKGN
jgi:hypothetical protein